MSDALHQLEAIQEREDRERDSLLIFVRQLAAGQYTKGRAIIRAKSLLREIAAGMRGTGEGRSDGR